MPVLCAGCGRAYEDALFAFGRTIHCTCGARVGVEAPTAGPLRRDRPPQLAADAMLGRLARWLRLLGLDVFWQIDVDDAELVRRAIEERRVLLTRDRGIAEAFRVKDLLLLRAEQPEAQLREVCAALALEPHFRPFTRCSLCNTLLAEATPAEVRSAVPERVVREHGEFRCCRSCGRVYWRGSHTERLLERVGRALQGKRDSVASGSEGRKPC